MKKDRGTGVVAEELKAQRRRVQRPWTEYHKTGRAHIQGYAWRLKKPPLSDAEADAVLDALCRWSDGAPPTVRMLRRVVCGARYACACAILKSHGLVASSPTKSRQLNRIGRERFFHAMWIWTGAS